jgi:hypothetical protein
MRCGLTWRHDPGPCPVDDTPHTACTPESVAAKHAITVAIRRPRTLPPPPPIPGARAELPGTIIGPPVSTKDYRRPRGGTRR